MSEEEPPDSLIGTRLAGFMLTKELGAGGSATVYRGEKSEPAVVVRAIKVIERAGAKKLDKRFKQEAQLLQKLEHPNIVKFYDASFERGRLFMVLELLEGQTLRERLKEWQESEKVPPLGEVLEIMAQAAEGVAFAHGFDEQAGKSAAQTASRNVVVHRDIKPENLFVTTNKTTKILDFGLAKALDDPEQKNLTTASTPAMATYAYLAPELWRSKENPNPKPTPQADVYALGITLFEALTRQHPFGDQDMWGYAEAHRKTNVPPLKTVRQDAPDLLDKLIQQATSKEPAVRHPTAKEFGAALRAVQRHWSSSLQTPAPDKLALAKNEIGAGTRTTAEVPTIRKEPVKIEAKVRPDERTRALQFWTVLLAVGLTGIVVAVLVSWLRKPEAGPGTVSSASAGPSAVAPSASAQTKADVCPSGMVFIPKGTFKIGSEDGDADEKGGGDTTVEAFCMDKTEVTVEAYAACVKKKDCLPAPTTVQWDGASVKFWSQFCNANRAGREKHPINCVDWNAATKYCETNGKRLPSEEEWEYAARGTDGRKYPWDSKKGEPNANLLNACGTECVTMAKEKGQTWKLGYSGKDVFPDTAPVGSFPEGESFYNVLDLAGNVWEWTSSYYSTNHSQANKSKPNYSVRVGRGGSWYSNAASYVRASNRGGNAPTNRYSDFGFRCASSPL